VTSDAPPPAGAAPGRARKSARIAAIVALTLVLVEVGVRVLDVPPRPLAPLAVADYRLSDDPVLGYEYVPNRGRDEGHFNDSHAGFATNADGFRDRDHEVAKSAGTCRVLVLGDSTTAGNGVPSSDDLYTSRLERALNATAVGSTKFEVFNMGVGGYHTLQEVETLRVKGLKYAPDVVLVTFCMNDFDPRSDGGVAKALAEKNRGRAWTPAGGAWAWFVRNSRLAFIVTHLLGDAPLDDAYERDVLKGRTTVRAGFELLSALQREHGFAALVVLLPSLHDPIARYPFAEIHRRAIETARDLPNVPVVDLLPKFAELPDDVRSYSIDGLHLNEKGHEAMARIVLPLLRDLATSRDAKR